MIQHPASLSRHIVDSDARAAMGISDRLLRLSIGLEEPDDPLV